MSGRTSAGMSRRQLLEAAGTTAAAAAVAAVGLAGPGEAAQPAPQPIADAWITFWNSRDVNSAAALFSEDAFYEDLTQGALNYHGLKEIQGFAQGYFSVAPADSVFTLTNAVEESDRKGGGHVIIEWLWNSTDPFWKTGKQVSVRGATVIDLAEGKIARNSDYWDLATALRQVGLLPKGL